MITEILLFGCDYLNKEIILFQKYFYEKNKILNGDYAPRLILKLLISMFFILSQISKSNN
jgi:hypothetical protein